MGFENETAQTTRQRVGLDPAKMYANKTRINKNKRKVKELNAFF